MSVDNLDFSRYQLGWSDDQIPVFKPKKGINEAIVREMSGIKNEDKWMLDFRLNALKKFEKKPMVPWFADRMPDLDFNDIYYYIKPTEGQVSDWDMLPEEMKTTYERLGIPEAERKFLAGVTAQYESEVVYHRNREDLERLGVFQVADLLDLFVLQCGFDHAQHAQAQLILGHHRRGQVFLNLVDQCHFR